MSGILGRLTLPNGGVLTLTAYAGARRGQRVQLTLEQGEGGIVAHGNTDADGIAQVVGWLETWLLDQGKRIGRPGASIDGPAPLALEELEHATPWSDRLEATDVAGSLEDFGAVGEERDAAFTRALERRRERLEPVNAADIWLAISAVREARDELAKHAVQVARTPVDLTELGPLTHYAAHFLEAKLELSAILSAVQGG